MAGLMDDLLDAVGRGLLDALPEKQTPQEIEECGRDLIAYVLTFEDQGLSVESAVQCWAEEWSLDE